MNAPAISLLMPTRGRPKLVERFLTSVEATTAHLDHIDVVLYVDDDDVGSHHLASDRIHVKRIIGPRVTMGACTTACLAVAQGEIIVLANDDMVIRTTGWDAKIAALHASMQDGVYLAYANDRFKDSSVCTFPILSRATCEMLGEPFPADYRGAFIDTHLMDIFKRVRHLGFDRIRYMKDVIFEHLHHRTGKAPFDDTYASRKRFDDDATYVALAPLRQVAALRLAGFIRGEEKCAWPSATKVVERPPRNLLDAVRIYTRAFLLDSTLPWSSRCYQWVRFIGRYLAARGWLWPFVR